MEVRITVGNKTWIVPQRAVPSLIGWLSTNAVEVGGNMSNYESNNFDDPKCLIVESK